MPCLGLRGPRPRAVASAALLAVGLVTLADPRAGGVALAAATRRRAGAAGALLVRGARLHGLLLMPRRTREVRPVRPRARAAAAGRARDGRSRWCSPRSTGPRAGSARRRGRRALARGLRARRPAASRTTLFQLVGMVLLENAVALAALGVAGGPPCLEFGVAPDLLLVVSSGRRSTPHLREFGSATPVSSGACVTASSCSRSPRRRCSPRGRAARSGRARRRRAWRAVAVAGGGSRIVLAVGALAAPGERPWPGPGSRSTPPAGGSSPSPSSAS